MGENICSHISDKELLSSTYRELLKLNKKQPDFEMVKD